MKAGEHMLPLKCVYQPYVELSEKKNGQSGAQMACNVLFIDCILDRMPQLGCLVLQHACVDVAPLGILKYRIAVAAICYCGWFSCWNCRFWGRGEFFASLHPRAVQVSLPSQRPQFSLHRHTKGAVLLSLYPRVSSEYSWC